MGGGGAPDDGVWLSVVVPAFNEVEALPLLRARLQPVLDGLGKRYEVVVVDDGSSDGTGTAVSRLAGEWPQLRLVRLTRNCGHQAALTAGLDVAGGAWVLTLDADLQDPPELIPTMLAEAARQRVDVVYARRSSRLQDGSLKRLTASAYYRSVRRLTGVAVEPQVGDFRLLSARVVAVLRQLPERERVYRVLIPWLGFPSATVDHPRERRSAGRTKYSLPKMALLASSSVVGFTSTPLRLATGLGLVAAAGSLLGVVATVVDAMAGDTVPGWTSLAVITLFLGSVQLVCLGLLGEYVGRIFTEVRRRPLYVVDDGAHPVPQRWPTQEIQAPAPPAPRDPAVPAPSAAGS